MRPPIEDDVAMDEVEADAKTCAAAGTEKKKKPND
jgi:hypothetical protein